MADCPERTIAPCTGGGVGTTNQGVEFGGDPDVTFGGQPVYFGKTGGCVNPPVVVACTTEPECDEDIPLVQFYQTPVSGDNMVVFQWYGLDPSYNIEYLIAGKFIEDPGGELMVFHHIDDIGQVADVAAPDTGLAEVGINLTTGALYSVSLRRVQDGKVGVWQQLVFVASDQPFPIFVVDGETMMIEVIETIASRLDVIVGVPIIDGYPTP